MTTLKYKKVYIDSKYTTPDSISSSDFSIELPEVLNCPDDTCFYVTELSIPRSWYVIEYGINNLLYLWYGEKDTPTNNYCFTVPITPGNYTSGVDMATEFQTAMNTATNNTKYPSIFTCTYNSKQNTIHISTGYTNLKFKILKPKDIASNFGGNWTGAIPINTSHPSEVNEILSNLEGYSGTYDTNTPFISGALCMQPFRNVYLHSNVLGSFDTISVGLNQNTIIKKIPVTTSGLNEYFFDDVVLFNDYLDCSKQMLKKIDFQLKSSRGDIIPLHGANISFTLVFTRANADV